MAKVKFCPNCMNIIHKKDTECKNCGMKVEDIDKEESVTEKLKPKKEKKVYLDEQGNQISKREQRKILESKEIDFEEAFLEEEEENSSNVDATEKVDSGEDAVENLIKRKRHKHKSKRKNKPEFSVDEKR